MKQRGLGRLGKKKLRGAYFVSLQVLNDKAGSAPQMARQTLRTLVRMSSIHKHLNNYDSVAGAKWRGVTCRNIGVKLSREAFSTTELYYDIRSEA